MKHDEFNEEIWLKVTHARNRLEMAGFKAQDVDDELAQLIREAVDKVCAAQARCAKLTNIGIK